MADNMILGENVVIEFYKDGDFSIYRCAIDVSIRTVLQTKETRTVGDGHWARTRGQKLSYTVSLTGLIDPEEINPTAWLLNNYLRNMTHIDFRMEFDEPETNLKKYISGKLLITQETLGGSSTGFATGDYEFEGFGPYIVSGAASVCSASIGNVSVNGSTIEGHPPGTASVNFTGLDNSSRIEYSVDGSGRDVIISSSPNGVFYIFGVAGTHDLILYPICEDGNDGIPYPITFTI